MSKAPEEPIAARDVVKLFGKNVRALDGATFALAPGEQACLLGPNGAGKTTLIRLLMGVFAPTSGYVHLFGEQTASPRYLEARRRVGIVPQSPGLYRDFSVRAYLTLVRDLFDRGNVEETLERFALAPFAARALSELSGGQQRRVVIAGSMLPSPELLLLDEPTVGLDPIATREVHMLLRDVMKGRAVLLCTHNLAEAEALSSSAVILREGKVLLHESIAQLRSQARPVLALAAEQGNETLTKALQQRGIESAVVEDEALVHAYVQDPQRDAPSLLRGLLSEGIDVYECRAVQPTLEELFVRIVGS